MLSLKVLSRRINSRGAYPIFAIPSVENVRRPSLHHLLDNIAKYGGKSDANRFSPSTEEGKSHVCDVAGRNERINMMKIYEFRCETGG